MAEPTERGAAAERMASVAMGIGVAGVVAGMVLIGLAVLTGGLPGMPPMGMLVSSLAGVMLALIGFGLVLRGVQLNITLDTLANVRLLQEETHRARTQAAVHSHAKREPMPELRPTSQMEPAPVAVSAPKERPKVSVPTGSVAQMPSPAKRAAVQTEQRASKAAPIKGKPFQPHPIFMAKPPK